MNTLFSSPLRALVLFVAFGSVLPQLIAHPHVFIDGILAPRVSFDGKYLLGTEVKWSFDQVYSAQLIFDFDKNRNSLLEKDEEQLVYKQAFQHLNEINYFLQAQSGAGSAIQHYGLGIAQDFRASIADNKIIYQFFIPFPEHQNKGIELEKGQEYILFLEDKEYFISFDSLLKKGLDSPFVSFGNKEFTVQNLQWGPYPVRVISVEAL